MAGKSPIEWTEQTWNPIVGCSIVSPGCTNCYAMAMAARIEAMNAEARESGPAARPMHPDWARSLRDQCAAAGVPFFFKQWGEWAPSTPEDARDNPRSGWQATAAHPHVAKAAELYPEAGARFVARVGKKAAGRLLDGVEQNGFPKVPA